MRSEKLYILCIEQKKSLKKYTTIKLFNKVFNKEFNKVVKQNGYYIYEFWK